MRTKPIWQKWWFWTIIVAFLLIQLLVTSLNEKRDPDPEISPTENNIQTH
ncbi:hypothetical protein [Alkalihalobacillus sp. AL-G]|nr:hypothetical protein [Alkalihalobacillus sp. AL-G]WLD91526.1 hypothetical protein MOJ78_10745 [Alkalihalobacillus sp. AL-G]